MSAPTPAQQRTARIAGIWFAVTILASIPAALLYDPTLNDVNVGADTSLRLGAFLEIVTAIANVATAVVLFPIVKRQSEAIALGYVATRIVESTLIVVGLISVLAIVTLRQDADALDAAGRSLVAVHDGTFLLGPAFCAGFGNGLLLGFLLYKAGLVPRRMALLGLIGGPLAFATATAVLFGAYEQTSGANFLFTVPEIAWEVSLSIYLIVKGFRPSPVLA